MSKSLDPDQDKYSVGPDLGPNCLERLSTEAKVAAGKEWAKITFLFALHNQTPILPLSTHKNYAPYFEIVEGAFCLLACLSLFPSILSSVTHIL